jgi:putative chitinase
MITLKQLQHVYKEAPLARLQTFLPLLIETMTQYEINTPQRMRMFLAQIGHESGQLCYTEELASGSDYEGRKDLGNDVPGDGVRYKGRGLIQLTGRTNYQLASMGLDIDLVDKPETLSQPQYAALSAGWFWKNNNLNTLCDSGQFKELSYRINGRKKKVNGVMPDPNGYADRYKLYQRACEVI